MSAKTREGFRRWLMAGMLWLGAAAAQAQILDSVDVTQDGNNALIRIRFAVLIQYLRHVPVDTGDAIRVFFQITASDDGAGVVEEERRSPPNDLVPRFRVLYPTQPPGVQRRVDILFDKPVTFRLRSEDNRTLALLVPLTDEQKARLRSSAAAPAAIIAAPAGGAPTPAAPLPPLPPALPGTPSDVDRQGGADYAEGRAALESGDFERATLALNRLLNLPPNAYTQAGQELIGVAREKGGEVAKARAEYELYLKLYPEGPGAQRVRERLAGLGPIAPPAAAGGPAAPAPIQPAATSWGSVSQYYYGGQSQATTTTTTITPATGATTIDTAKITATDQSQLITNVDFTARYRSENWDSRAVVRDSYNANFLNRGNSQNRLTALYGESRYLPWQLMGRLGRQSGTSGGILGLFDGAYASWGFRPGWRANGVVGQPVDPPFGTHKSFYGASVDADNLAGRFGGNLFAIRQTVGGREDRLGVGGEFRYFDAERNVYSLFDYDPTFKAVNIGMVQGTWQFPTATTLNFIADYRRTPTLQLTNALVANPTSSLDSLVQTYGLSAVRDLAKTLTPTSKVYLVGVTQQLSPKWQLGFDLRLSSLAGTAAVQSLPAAPGTGNIYTYTLQAIGNSLTKFQDILVVNGSVLRGDLFDAWLLGLDYRFVVLQNLTIEPLLKFYQQKDNQGIKLTRTSPGIRLAYRIRDRLTLEAELDLERSRQVGPLIDDDVTRRFFYVGWRWDL